MNQYENGNYDSLYTVIHAIEPRAERNVNSLKNTDMPWRSVYLMASGEILRESGYKRFPVLAPRWDVMDDYGISPSMWALPDIKQLQVEQLRKGQGIDQQNNPTRLIPASMKNAGVNLLPGGVIYAKDVYKRQGKALLPVREGAIVNITYTNLHSSTLYFVYAEGSRPV